MRRGWLVVVLTSVGVILSAQSQFRPAQYVDGQLPLVPPLAVGGGEVFLELAVTSAGRVASVTTLRTTPPFTSEFVAVAKNWRFRPAEQLTESLPGNRQTSAWQPVDAKVLVAGIFRPPTLNAPTLGQLPQNVGKGSDDAPFPLTVIAPPFPPLARDDGTSLVQVTVDVAGHAVETKVVRSAPGFDEVALAAARGWTFRPARLRSGPVTTYAYLVFAFRQPVTGSPRTGDRLTPNR